MKPFTLVVVLALAAGGCQTMSGPDRAQAPPEGAAVHGMQLHQYVDQARIDTATRELAAKGLESLDEGRLDDASKLFNTALRLDLANSQLQFLNALTYHLMAANGDAQAYTLAEQGYQLARKFDSSNWLARYYLGLALLNQGRYDEAQYELASAAIMNDADPEVLYDLAYASYYAGDVRTAAAALEKLAGERPERLADQRFLQAMAITKAALNQADEARSLLLRFDEVADDPRRVSFLTRRLSAWESFHNDPRARQFDAFIGADDAPGRLAARTVSVSTAPLVGTPPVRLAQVLPQGGGAVPVIPGAAASEAPVPGAAVPAASGSFVDGSMVVVDVVIIRTQEDISTSKGLNLLSGLQLQFGDPLTPTPGLGYSRTRSYGSNATSDTSIITNLISLPAVTYSLNIFNTLAASNDVLARPSLVALAGERSEFFSGVDVVAAAVSGGDGSSVSINKAIGVKLSVTPEFLPGDQVRLEVEAERTFLTTPSSSVVFEFRLDTSKTEVNANVVMKFGETLVLSGLSEEETENTRNSVPFLGDLPMVQYLFARQGDRHFRKSVIILLTPRRAHYVNRAAEDVAAEERELSEFERTVRAFEKRNESYFVPRSTITDALGWARYNSMFHEFKTGDFAMEKWQSRKTNEDRLRDAVEFLFF